VFAYQDGEGPVEVAFTDRHRGIGGGPSASLDLSSRGTSGPGGSTSADEVSDALDLVSRCLAAAPADPDAVGSAAAGQPRTVVMRQVHGAEVTLVDQAFLRRGDVPVADGLVTRLTGVVLVVRVADCVPLLLADPDAGVVGAVHVGRAGLVAGVVPEAIAVMRASGASRVRGWVGPHVCGRCYEVPVSMREEVAAVVPEAHAVTSWGTPSVDIGAGVLAQLRRDDVAVTAVSRCTVEDQDLFSYRREGTGSGRLGGLVWRRP
jgi:hypothetical protein